MQHLFIGLLAYSFTLLGQPKEFYYYKDSLTTEVIGTNGNGFYECYKMSALPHTFPFYSQGTYQNIAGGQIFKPGIVDSLDLIVKESTLNIDKNSFFTSKVKIVGNKSNVKQLYNFNYDQLNDVSYDIDIKLCMEDAKGTKFYKRLNTNNIDFGEVVTENNPSILYIMVGSYVVTQKYHIKNQQSNYFEISLNEDNLLGSFKDSYLANHEFSRTNEGLKDLFTGRVYKRFLNDKDLNKIYKIANTIFLGE